jgi:hypothetical protein
MPLIDLGILKNICIVLLLGSKYILSILGLQQQEANLGYKYPFHGIDIFRKGRHLFWYKQLIPAIAANSRHKRKITQK